MSCLIDHVTIPRLVFMYAAVISKSKLRKTYDTKRYKHRAGRYTYYIYIEVSPSWNLWGVRVVQIFKCTVWPRHVCVKQTLLRGTCTLTNNLAGKINIYISTYNHNSASYQHFYLILTFSINVKKFILNLIIRLISLQFKQYLGIHEHLFVIKTGRGENRHGLFE